MENEPSNLSFSILHEMDFNSPVKVDISQTTDTTDLLNKSFKQVHNTLTQDDCSNSNSDTSASSFNKSLVMLSDLGNLLAANMTNNDSPGPKVSACIGTEEYVRSHLLPTKAHRNNLIDKGVQVMLDTYDDHRLNVTIDKCNELESRNSGLIQDIKCLNDKIRHDKKMYEDLLTRFKIQSEENQLIIQELNTKLSNLEDLIRFRDKHELMLNISPSRYKKINVQEYISKFSTNNEGHISAENCNSNEPSIMRNDKVDIEILADSHGRKLSQLISSKISSRVFGLIKPNAKASEVLHNKTSLVRANTPVCFLTIILAGANDIYCNETKNYLRTLKRYLSTNFHSNIILCTIPQRFDLPFWSIVNKEIRYVNQKIKNLQKFFKNLYIVDIGNLGKQFHTRQGIHLNSWGKSYLCDRIVEIYYVLNRKVFECNTESIYLPWQNQGN